MKITKENRMRSNIAASIKTLKTDNYKTAFKRPSIKPLYLTFNLYQSSLDRERTSAELSDTPLEVTHNTEIEGKGIY